MKKSSCSVVLEAPNLLPYNNIITSHIILVQFWDNWKLIRNYMPLFGNSKMYLPLKIKVRSRITQVYYVYYVHRYTMYTMYTSILCILCTQVYCDLSTLSYNFLFPNLFIRRKLGKVGVHNFTDPHKHNIQFKLVPLHQCTLQHRI